jgi:phosphoglycerate kinase
MESDLPDRPHGSTVPGPTRMQTLDDLSAAGRTVGVRVDVNSPLVEDTDEPALADDARLRAHVETLSELLDRDARLLVLAHQGRPGGEEFAPLSAHADRFDDLLSGPVDYVDAPFGDAVADRLSELGDGEALLAENTRFYAEEYMEFDPARAARTHLVRRLAPLLDAYVNDAFAAAHRAQPSLVGFPERVPAYAGRVMEREVQTLRGVTDAARPRAFLVGGAKVGDALDVAWRALDTGLADELLVTGLVANAFLLADGVDLGSATAGAVEADWIDRAADLLDAHGDRLHLPRDVAVDRDGRREELGVNRLPPRDGERALDVGPATVERYRTVLDRVQTVVLNGPAGVYEDERFRWGTRRLFAAATGVPTSIVGGGDTAAAVRELGIEGFDHVSTGGGAALRALTGRDLPAVAALERAAVERPAAHTGSSPDADPSP